MMVRGNKRRSPGSFMRRLAALSGVLLLSACATAPQDEGTVFYPPLPELPRLQFLTTINAEKDIGGRSGGGMFGSQRNSDKLVRPFDVAHDKGKIYIVDPGLQGLVIVDLVAKKIEHLQETDGGPFQNPMGIFIAENGYKYIADAGREQILVLDENDKFLRAYGRKDQFWPLAVAVDGDRVYVVDRRESEIEVLDRESGELIHKIGGVGTEGGRFQWPTRVALDSEGSLFVTDFMNFRIQKLSREGRFIRAFGENGNWPGATPRPKGIAVDRDGNLYVVDGAFELVQIFDSNSAQVLMGFGKFGPKPGANWLPAGITIDYDNLDYFARYVDKNFRAKYLVYVVNQAGFRKLNVYAFGEWIGPMPEGAQPPAES